MTDAPTGGNGHTRTVISAGLAALIGLGGGTFGSSQFFEERIIALDSVRQVEVAACRKEFLQTSELYRKDYDALLHLYREDVAGEVARCDRFLAEARSACLATMDAYRQDQAELLDAYEQVSLQLSACLNLPSGRSGSSGP